MLLELPQLWNFHLDATDIREMSLTRKTFCVKINVTGTYGAFTMGKTPELDTVTDAEMSRHAMTCIQIGFSTSRIWSTVNTT